MEDTPSFFLLHDEYFDIQEFVSSVFTNVFYQHLGRNRTYPLTGFLSILILQKIFSIPTDSLLMLFLSVYKELRDFCRFSKVPDAPPFTRFRQMVDFTEPSFHLIDSFLAQIFTFDTSGIELFVTENNLKTLKALIKKLTAFYNDNPEVNPYKIAYGHMLKTNICIAGKHTRNHKTTKADVFLAEIARKLTVIVTFHMNCPKYIQS